MSVEVVKDYFRQWSMEESIQEFTETIATVADAAKALRCEEERIAKTLSFLVNSQAILIVMAGDAKVDNQKYKAKFLVKPTMLNPEQVVDMIGHPVGGVCPFGIKHNTNVYLDESLKRFRTVFPACGSRNSAIELTLDQLEQHSGYREWVNVSKGWE